MLLLVLPMKMLVLMPKQHQEEMSSVSCCWMFSVVDGVCVRVRPGMSMFTSAARSRVFFHDLCCAQRSFFQSLLRAVLLKIAEGVFGTIYAFLMCSANKSQIFTVRL